MGEKHDDIEKQKKEKQKQKEHNRQKAKDTFKDFVSATERAIADTGVAEATKNIKSMVESLVMDTPHSEGGHDLARLLVTLSGDELILSLSGAIQRLVECLESSKPLNAGECAALIPLVCVATLRSLRSLPGPGGTASSDVTGIVVGEIIVKDHTKTTVPEPSKN